MTSYEKAVQEVKRAYMRSHDPIELGRAVNALERLAWETEVRAMINETELPK